MTKKESDAIKGAKVTSITTIVVAVLGLVGTLAVGYWQFVIKPPGDVPVPKVVYYGRVIDINNNLPVSSAKVGLYLEGLRQITYTDSEGVYQFILNVNSDLNGSVVVEAEGYEIYTRNIVVSSNARPLEDIRITQQNKVLTPTLDVPFPVTPLPSDTPQPTNTPQVPDILVGMIDNYYGCINDAAHDQRDDYAKCWNLLSNKPGEYQESLNNKSGGVEGYISFWNAYKVSYNLYYCPKGNDVFVNSEYYLYEWGDLSKPLSIDPLFLEYSFALDGSGWRIKGGRELKNKVGSYCEDQPKVIRPAPGP